MKAVGITGTLAKTITGLATFAGILFSGKSVMEGLDEGNIAKAIMGGIGVATGISQLSGITNEMAQLATAEATKTVAEGAVAGADADFLLGMDEVPDSMWDNLSAEGLAGLKTGDIPYATDTTNFLNKVNEDTGVVEKAMMQPEDSRILSKSGLDRVQSGIQEDILAEKGIEKMADPLAGLEKTSVGGIFDGGLDSIKEAVGGLGGLGLDSKTAGMGLIALQGYLSDKETAKQNKYNREFVQKQIDNLNAPAIPTGYRYNQGVV